MSHFGTDTAHKNECVVKYIHLKPVDANRLHTLADYELDSKRVYHSSYDELHEQVFLNCPMGFKCTEPLALYHAPYWSSGLAVRQNAARQTVFERDVLRHAIEPGEYARLWGATRAIATICVDVVETFNRDLPRRPSPPATVREASSTPPRPPTAPLRG